MRAGTQLSIVGAETSENAGDEVSFGSFWTLYPRKEAKKDALKAWAEIGRDQWPEIITAVASWRREWARRETHYIPLPASWLRGERWTDELPAGVVSTAAAHMPMPKDAPFVKAELPDHVRAMLAKLKGPK